MQTYTNSVCAIRILTEAFSLHNSRTDVIAFKYQSNHQKELNKSFRSICNTLLTIFPAILTPRCFLRPALHHILIPSDHHIHQNIAIVKQNNATYRPMQVGLRNIMPSPGIRTPRGDEWENELVSPSSSCQQAQSQPQPSPQKSPTGIHRESKRHAQSQQSSPTQHSHQVNYLNMSYFLIMSSL